MKLDDLPSAEHAPIVLSGLTRRFGERVVLDGLNLSIPAGQFLAVVGRSGCGKSTLLRRGQAQGDVVQHRLPRQQPRLLKHHPHALLRRLGQQLEWLRLRLLELDADKARFLRHVSHELKTPLAALREGVALLQDGVTGELTAGQREVAQILHHNTLQLQDEIEALLRFNAAAFEARQLQHRDVILHP